jgi:hypothetical protein
LPQSSGAATTAAPTVAPSTGQVNLVTAVTVALGMLFVGLVAGLVVTRKSGASKL